MYELLTRRQVLRAAGVVGLGVTAGGVLVLAGDDDSAAGRLHVTPSQTSGPFYPQPEIARQPFHDNDLVRRMKDDEPGRGEVIVVTGAVRDREGRPIEKAVVEIWQACSSGRYNHARDDNPAKLDERFQYWGRGVTGKSGTYTFRTIKPGEYPGRTSHLHYRVLAPGFRGVVTQMYFAENAAANARDGIYNALNRADRNAVTVEFAKETGKDVPRGTFDLVLAAK